MKKNVTIQLSIIIASIIMINLNYGLILSGSSNNDSLSVVKKVAIAQNESGLSNYDEEPYTCHACGKVTHTCIPVLYIASCNVSGQIPCEELCDDNGGIA